MEDDFIQQILDNRAIRHFNAVKENSLTELRCIGNRDNTGYLCILTPLIIVGNEQHLCICYKNHLFRMD